MLAIRGAASLAGFQIQPSSDGMPTPAIAPPEPV